MTTLDINQYLLLKEQLYKYIDQNDYKNIISTIESINEQKNIILEDIPINKLTDAYEQTNVFFFVKNFDHQMVSLVLKYYNQQDAILQANTDPDLVPQLLQNIENAYNLVKTTMPPLFYDLISFISQNPR